MRRAPTLPLLSVLLVLGVPRAGEAEPRRKDAGAVEAVAASLDRSVAPCEDLYGFACGGWIAGAEVPGWTDRWSRGTDALRQENFETLRRILEAAPRDPEKDPDHGRVGLFYSSCMAQTIVEERGPGPLRPMMRRIAVARNATGLAQVLAGMHRIGIDALWSARVLPDAGDPPRYLLHLLPGGLGLPDPALYLAEDAETVAVRERYVAHMAAMLAVLGEGAAGSSEKAAAVLALETRLARAAAGTGTPGGPAVDRAQLGKLAPGFPWDTYFEALRAPEVDQVGLPEPDLLRAVEAILAGDDLASLRSSLRWQILRSTAPYLSSDLAGADFELF
ncbi:MAG: M13 family metallopeptidase N-terminal domain-containing protein, partial [Acidobacteriota bacterium]